ncbi:uncharacterized protein LOC144110868 [Amblyomma americanum]
MTEADRVRHVLKGIGSLAFNALAVQNPTTVDDIIATCQRLDQLQSIRLQPDPAASLLPSDSDLRALIRALIREELLAHGSPCLTVPAPSAPSSTGAGLRSTIKEELASVACSLAPDTPAIRPPPTYAQVAAMPPVFGPPPTPAPPRDHVSALAHQASTPPFSSPWRPSRPICYYCGFRGHISRFCRRRLQDERRGYAAFESGYSTRAPSPQRHAFPNSLGRSSSPPPTSARPRSYRSTRARSPSPIRRSSSPLQAGFCGA